MLNLMGSYILELKVNDGQYWGYTKEVRVNGLCKDHIIKLGTVVYSGATKIAANQGHYNINGAFYKGQQKVI